MTNKTLNNLNQGDLIWILWPILLVCMPLIVFGSPGYYGDDFNMLDSLELHQGIIGSMSSWILEYGVFYRPFGIYFLNLIYSMLGYSETLMYIASLAIYSALIFLIYRSSISFYDDKSLAIFATLFFASFPFNATAYLQISSIYMMFTCLCCLILIKKFYLNHKSIGLFSNILFALFWLILLFSYEQITGLIAVIFTLILFKYYYKGVFESLYASTVINGLLIFITSLFILIFFLSPGNPKVKTLNDLNQVPNNIEQQFSEGEIEGKLDLENIQTSSISKSRFKAINSKIKRSLLFL